MLCCKINVSPVWKGPSREKGADKDVSGERMEKGDRKRVESNEKLSSEKKRVGRDGQCDNKLSTTAAASVLVVDDGAVPARKPVPGAAGLFGQR